MKRGVNRRYLPQITNIDKFKELYYTVVPYKEMAKEFGVKESYIGFTARRLKLPKRGQLYRKMQKEKNDDSILMEMVDYLAKNGVTQVSTIKKQFGLQRVTRILRKNPSLFLKLEISWSGAYRGRGSTKKASRYIKQSFVGKTFIALKKDRTAIIRFLMSIFKREQEYKQYDAKVIFQWLRRFKLSRAEKTAIMTNLGYIYKRREHMMIDGCINDIPTPKAVTKKALNQFDDLEVA